MNTQEEYHVASFVTQVIPSEIENISNFICQVEGGEVHASDPQGKIVFTIESQYQKDIANKADTIRQCQGVLTLAPVYHQYLTEE